jgi:hypothetical protein
MNRSYFRRNLTLLTAIATLLLGASLHGIAEDATSTISGRVVGVDGNPIAGVSLVVQTVEIFDGGVWPTYIQKDTPISKAYAALPKSQTDEAGRFSFTSIKPGPIQFVAQPPQLPADLKFSPDLFNKDIFEPDAEILSIEIGGMICYPPNQKQPLFGGLTFAIEPGTYLENVAITVRPRMRIRGRIVFADGTPLANAKVQISVRRRDFNGSGSSSLGSAPRTDDAGYFVQYVDEPGFYTVAVKFQGLSTRSEQFILEARQRHDGLVLKFDSGPIPIDPAPGQVGLDSVGTWVLNPENGHSYKRVHCESWDDAQAKAIAEDAHLVSINDAAEQQWLVSIFGTAPCWIGLTDVAKEGEWGWTSGEPLTYFNWAFHKLIDADRGDEDYVFMGLSPDGRWHKVGPQSPEWQMPRMTILEKEGLPTQPSAAEK